MGDDKEAKPEQSMVFKLAKDVVLPLAAALVAYFAAGDKTDKSQAQVDRGYAAVVQVVNPLSVKLDAIERRVDALERADAVAHAPTPAPTPVNITIARAGRGGRAAPASAPTVKIVLPAKAPMKAPPPPMPRQLPGTLRAF